MILRRRLLLFFCGVLLFASGAFGKGEYQQTRDNKTMVWNGTPKAGETSSWSGDRDKENYASGFGDLTWYNATGKVYALYYGNMVHGKFEGAVNLHTNGRVAHAYFADGGRVTGWARGPAPSRMNVPEQAVAERRKAEAENIAAQKRLAAATPEPAKKSTPEPEKARPVEPVVSKPETKPEIASQKPQVSPLEQPSPEEQKETAPGLTEKKIGPIHENTQKEGSVFEPTPIPTKSEIRSEKPEVSGPTESSAPALDTRLTESASPSIQEAPPVTQEPTAEPKTEIAARTSEIAGESSPAPAKQESPIGADVSLNALVGPPSSLRTTSSPEVSPEQSQTQSSPTENAPLTEDEAISLADIEARVQGYHLHDYERPKVDHSRVNGKWSLFYGLKKTESGSERPATLIVTVEDKTRKVEIRK